MDRLSSGNTINQSIYDTYNIHRYTQNYLGNLGIYYTYIVYTY